MYMLGARLSLVFLTIFFLFTTDCQAWETYVGTTLEATMERLEPGNILIVKSDGNDLSIRFYGIGIPTEKQPFGGQAREFIEKTLPKGAKLILTTVNKDEEGIIRALVQYNDRSINNMLVEEGLAWVDRRECKAFFCRRWHIQEHLAIKERKGVWSLNLTSPPWQWGD